MPGIGTLHSTRTQLEGDLHSKEKLADSLKRSAETHRSNGNDNQADLDEKSALRYENDASIAREKLQHIEEEIRQNEDKKAQIESQIAALDSDYKQKRDQLQSELQKVA